MPVFPVFDPTTGASGGASSGGGGGGTSLADLTPIPIDLTDGSWTLLDTDGLVSSVSHSGGFNTVIWNTVVADAKYNWSTASGGQSAPRWYKRLVIGTTQVTSTDTLLFTTEMEASRTDDFLSKVILTAAEAPTDTDVAVIRATGGAANKVSATQISGGTYSYSAETVTQNAALGKSISTSLRGHESLGVGCYIALNDSDPATGISMGSRPSNRSNAGAAGAGQDLWIMVGVGPKTSAIGVTAGDQQRFALSFVAATLAFGA